jgi:hypothetical protein
MTLRANDYLVKQNQVFTVPIYLDHPTKLNDMNWTMHYDTNVVRIEPPQVTQGKLPLKLFSPNAKEAGLIRMGFANQDNPIEQGGILAYVTFKATGAPGSKTPLTFGVTKVDDPAGKQLDIRLVHGSVEIVKDHHDLVKGCCFGNSEMGIEDARCALEMSVKLRPEWLNMDMDGGGSVTSRDAAIILKMVLDRVRTGQ